MRQIRKRQILVCFLASLACIQLAAYLILSDLNAQYVQVDSAFNAIQWNAKYAKTNQGESDYQEFISRRASTLFSLPEIRLLAVLKKGVLVPTLRARITATLKSFEPYVALAEKNGAGESSARSIASKRKLKHDEIAKLIGAFRYTAPHGCDVPYRDLLDSVNAIARSKPPRYSTECLLAASKALLDQVESPLRDYLPLVEEEYRDRIWSDQEYQLLRKIAIRIQDQADAPDTKPLRERVKKAFEELATRERSEKLGAWYYGWLGFDLIGVLFEPNPKAGLSFGGLTEVISPYDIRVMVGPEYLGDPYYPRMLIHELGHAIAITATRRQPHRLLESSLKGYGETLADLLLTEFLEPEVLKATPEKALNALAEMPNIENLRFFTPAALQLYGNVPEHSYQMRLVRTGNRPILQAAEDFLKEWPSYKWNTIALKRLSLQERALLFTVWDLEFFLDYPLYTKFYADSAIQIGAIMSQNTRGSTTSAQEIHKLAEMHRRALYAGAEGASPKEAFLNFGIDIDNRESLLEGYARFLHVSAKDTQSKTGFR